MTQRKRKSRLVERSVLGGELLAEGETELSGGGEEFAFALGEPYVAHELSVSATIADGRQLAGPPAESMVVPADEDEQVVGIGSAQFRESLTLRRGRIFPGA